MNFLGFMETFLYVLSSALLYPVVLGLIFLVFWVLFLSGEFLRDWAERRNGINPVVENFKNFLEKLVKEKEDLEELETEVYKKLKETEINLIKDLDRIRSVVRVGPALGLLGTLIPMGIALAQLAKGNLPKMASHMVTAFTTTVVGLACGVVAYVITLIKERWIKETVTNMEYLADKVLLEVKKRSE
ncbi:MAG: MotA/TolQ/ExbB proton channel family protein [Thermodesulfobacteria bacterium]|nr:MotA/TolQ/ExbB proton channel family protein [Thermodesulfobacteriota bacterium]